jgi:hypothetical protein
MRCAGSFVNQIWAQDMMRQFEQRRIKRHGC